MAENYRKLIRILLSIVLVLGILMLFSNPIKDYIVEYNVKKATVQHFSAAEIKKNQRIVEQEMQKTNSEIVSFDIAAVEPVDTASTLQELVNQKKYPVVAGIAIPSVEINLPIFK